MLQRAKVATGYLLILLLLALGLLLAGCGEQAAVTSTPAVTADGKTLLRKGNGAEPATLDPHQAQGVPAANILRDLYEGLVSEAPDGSLIPGGAESWEISEDGTVYTFHLRKEARWSNGDPVTAEDYAYGLRRSVDPMTGSSYAEVLAPIVNTHAVIIGDLPPEELGVEVLDPYTLRIRLRAPTPYFLGLLTHASTYPVHQATAEKYGDQFTQPDNSVVNGAYKLKEWVVNSHITLERNPQYWNDAATRIDRVKYFGIDDAESEFKRYRAGDLDMTATVPKAHLEWVKQNIPEQYKAHPALAVYYYGLNTTRPPFKDNVKLRTALSLAIDRKIMVEKVTRGGEIPAYGWVPPRVKNYEPQRAYYADWPREKQIAEAKRLYEEAGYSEDDPLRTQIRYNTSEGHKEVAVAVANMWKVNLGVQVELVNEEWKVFLQNVKLKQKTQVFRAGWVGDYNDPYTFLELLHSDFGLNGSGYSNPSYDKLLEQAAREADEDKRAELLQQAEQILLNDQPVIPIYFYVNKTLLKPYVEGYEGNLMDHHHSRHLAIEVPAQSATEQPDG